MIDKVLDKNQPLFAAQIEHLANSFVADKVLLQTTLAEKAETRRIDEAKKALVSYRKFELTQMYADFYGNDLYHQARKNFVYKVSDNETPENIALHRQSDYQRHQTDMANVSPFCSLAQYEVGDETMDVQHKELFDLAAGLLTSASKQELLILIHIIYQHVEEHFRTEEAEMKQLNYQENKQHTKEHHKMLKKLSKIDHKINDGRWKQSKVQGFVQEWGEHIIDADMSFNRYKVQRVGS